MAVIMSKQMVIPVIGKRLSDYAHGETVKLNENGTPVEFYVAKHDYESNLNGTGRTLLVRKDCYDYRQWNSDYNDYRNMYANSDINSWLNGTYKNMLDTAVQSAIGTTTFYYTLGNDDDTVSTLSRGIFLLSLNEFGVVSSTLANREGSTLSIASTLRVAYRNEAAVDQWTRSPHTNDYSECWYVTSAGRASYTHFGAISGSRPVFTLSGDTLFNSKTNELLEVV